MLRERRDVLLTAAAPVVWGSTYAVTTELLPPDRPLFAALARALPAGLVLLALTRRPPSGDWWWRAAVLGTLNTGAFFALLFVAAHRLPGGVAATVGAVQPLVVLALAAVLLGEVLTRRAVGAAVLGCAGVALLVLRADAALDGPGVLAALAGAVSMATGVVLTRRWRPPVPPLTSAAWQLVAGGLVLAPVALVLEGPPPRGLTAANALGYGYLGLVGTALAYVLWFRGISRLPAGRVAALGLLSPLVATALGVLVVGERLSPWQVLGAVAVLVAVALVRPAPAGVATGSSEVRPTSDHRVRQGGAGDPRARAAARPPR